MNCKTETLQDQKEMLVEKSVSGSAELQKLQEKLGLLRAAVDMGSNESRPTGFYVNQLNDPVELKMGKIVEMESHW